MLRRLLHIWLACLILLSSTGVVFSKHYCRGSLQTVAVFTKAKSCHDVQRNSCPMHAGNPKVTKHQDNNCCDNQVAFLKSDIDQTLSAAQYLPAAALSLLLALPFASPALNVNWEAQHHAYLCFQPPPPRWSNITVEWQIFLC